MSATPELPDVIEIEDAGEQEGASDATAATTFADPRLGASWWPWHFRSLRHGCYLMRWTPTVSFFGSHYDGTLRVERAGLATTASGDLYYHPPAWYSWMRSTPEPNPSRGVPTFRRSRYSYYVRVTRILQWITTTNTFVVEWELHGFQRSTQTWSPPVAYTAEMEWTSAPAGYPDPSQYLQGVAKRKSDGMASGALTIGWVSPFLRKATVEIDSVSGSEQPVDNGSGSDWQDVFNQVSWQITVDQSATSIPEASGESWSDDEMHARMLTIRDSSDLDAEWRYHLLCVRRLDSTSRGIMYDAYGGDSNNVPREGAGISSHWKIPNTSVWGDVRGDRFGAAAGPYFRTAVHELGHAMGLYHNTVNNGFMNTTGTIAASAGVFPNNVLWEFAEDDAKRLRHAPDPWVRPGGAISFGGAYNTAPISDDDGVIDAEGLTLHVSPLLDAVPIGAPVRFQLDLRNDTDVKLPVPHSLSLRHGHVRGRVVGPNGETRLFWPLIRCLEEEPEATMLEPNDVMSDAATLLRGPDGALFPSPGQYRVVVEAQWEVEGRAVGVSGSAEVMVTGAFTDSHAEAAAKALSTPDLLLSLVIGGDHHVEANAALNACLADDTLRPHFAIIEAKRLAKRTTTRRKSDVKGAIELLAQDPVLSGPEARRAALIAQGADANTKRTKAYTSAKRALIKTADEVSAQPDVVDEIDKL